MPLAGTTAHAQVAKDSVHMTSATPSHVIMVYRNISHYRPCSNSRLMKSCCRHGAHQQQEDTQLTLTNILPFARERKFHLSGNSQQQRMCYVCTPCRWQEHLQVELLQIKSPAYVHGTFNTTYHGQCLSDLSIRSGGLRI